MSSITIRQSLLRHQVAVILLLSGAILATTFVGAQSAIQTLSSTLIDRAVQQTESELHRFIDPVERTLRLLCRWGSGNVLVPSEDGEAERFLVPMLEESAQILSVTIADPRWGAYRQWREGGRRLAVAEAPDWHRQALVKIRERGAGAPYRQLVYWTEPYRLASFEPNGSQRLGMTAAVAFALPGGDLGAVALDLPLDGLNSFVRRIHVTENGLVSILAEGRILALPDDPRLWQADPEYAVLRTPEELRTPLVEDALRGFASRPEEERGTPMRFSSGGEWWWGQVRQFPLSPERALAIAVLVPSSDLWGDRAQLRALIVLVTAVVLAGAIARSMTLSRRFSRPIEALVIDSERISHGDLEPRPREELGLHEVDQLALAHERMRLGLQSLLKLERDLQLARQIQQQTIPLQLPQVTGFDLVAWSQPAEATGGDTYDAIALGADGNGAPGSAGAVLLLADASGHGIGPALSVTQVRSMLRMAVRAREDLEQVAAHLNEQLYADLPLNQFVTAWIAELSGDSHRLRTFSAGQGPMLYLPADGQEVRMLAADTPPLGLFPVLSIPPVQSIELLPGDLYLVASDGCFEAASEGGEELGRERFCRLLIEHRDETTADLLAALRRGLDEFTGGAAPTDDRTILIIRRN